jgi:hypothetical protein
MALSYHDTQPAAEWSADESRPVALHIGTTAERTARDIEPLSWLASCLLIVALVLGAVHLVARWLP